VDRCSLDAGIIGNQLTQIESKGNIQVFNHFGNDNESKLIEGQFFLKRVELSYQLHLLQSVALFHQLNHQEVGHVVVGKCHKIIAHDVNHHVEVDDMLEVVNLLLDG